MGRTPLDLLEDELANANTYGEWKSLATRIDNSRGFMNWRLNPASNVYDQLQIQQRTHILSGLRKSKDYAALGYNLRSGLLRNFCGINDPRLYAKYYTGTKVAIEEYIDQVVSVLEHVAKTPFDGVSNREKLELLADSRQSFGRTALLLQGGSTFGLVHMGVAKCLFEQNMLPKIICGNSVGALIAALVCIKTEEELPDMLNGTRINLEAFAKKRGKGTIGRKITRFLTKGYFLDVKVIEDVVRQNLGELTFEEAFLKTHRILNIVVSSSRKQEVPSVLNYLTAPNVLIWSAAVASCSSMGLYDQVTLLAKDENGDIVPFSPSEVKWNAKWDDTESPETRLSELFNVNHLIVSQATPYLAPFLSQGPQHRRKSGWVGRLMTFLTLELRHRLHQLGRLKLAPARIITLLDYKTQGNITITPPLSSHDFYTIFSSPTVASLSYWILKGERATWPLVSLIKNRLSVELALEREHAKVKAERDKLSTHKRSDSKSRQRRSN